MVATINFLLSFFSLSLLCFPMDPSSSSAFFLSDDDEFPSDHPGMVEGNFEQKILHKNFYNGKQRNNRRSH
jgi:hypothetical protein